MSAEQTSAPIIEEPVVSPQLIEFFHAKEPFRSPEDKIKAFIAAGMYYLTSSLALEKIGYAEENFLPQEVGWIPVGRYGEELKTRHVYASTTEEEYPEIFQHVVKVSELLGQRVGQSVLRVINNAAPNSLVINEEGKVVTENIPFILYRLATSLLRSPHFVLKKMEETGERPTVWAQEMADTIGDVSLLEFLLKLDEEYRIDILKISWKRAKDRINQ